jgi:hypothetical protein
LPFRGEWLRALRLLPLFIINKIQIIMNYQTIIFLAISLFAYIACDRLEKTEKTPATTQQEIEIHKFTYRVQYEEFIKGETFYTMQADTLVTNLADALEIFEKYKFYSDVAIDKESKVTFSIIENKNYSNGRKGPDSIEHIQHIYPPYVQW